MLFHAQGHGSSWAYSGITEREVELHTGWDMSLSQGTMYTHIHIAEQFSVANP